MKHDWRKENNLEVCVNVGCNFIRKKTRLSYEYCRIIPARDPIVEPWSKKSTPHCNGKPIKTLIAELQRKAR